MDIIHGGVEVLEASPCGDGVWHIKQCLLLHM
jgi:hypothetical protein